MLFARPDGEGVVVDGPSKRAKPTLDQRIKVFARAETWERYQVLGFSVEAIGSIFNISKATIHADLKALRDARAQRDGGASLIDSLLTAKAGLVAPAGP